MEVENGNDRLDFGFECKFVGKVGQFSKAVLPVVRIKCHWQDIRVGSADNLHRVCDRNLEDRFLAWEKISKLESHRLLLFLSIPIDCRLSTCYCVCVLLLGCLFIHNLRGDHFVVKYGLKF